MQGRLKLFISAASLALFAVVLFGAARFFYLEADRIFQTCSSFPGPPSNCLYNDANKIPLFALWSGVTTFTLTGLAVWSIAAYVAFKLYRTAAAR